MMMQTTLLISLSIYKVNLLSFCNVFLTFYTRSGCWANFLTYFCVTSFFCIHFLFLFFIYSLPYLSSSSLQIHLIIIDFSSCLLKTL